MIILNMCIRLGHKTGNESKKITPTKMVSITEGRSVQMRKTGSNDLNHELLKLARLKVSQC